MTSPVNWALLGLVIDRPSYGFELARRFERTYGEILPVSGESHLYKALSRLEMNRLVEVVPGTEVARQPKPHYRATPLGLSRYEDWFVGQVDAELRRQELWVRQLAVIVRDPQAAVGVIERVERLYQERAGQIGRLTPGDERCAVIDGLVAEQRRIAVGGMLLWLRHAHERFAVLAGMIDEQPPRT